MKIFCGKVSNYLRFEHIHFERGYTTCKSPKLMGFTGGGGGEGTGVFIWDML